MKPEAAERFAGKAMSWSESLYSLLEFVGRSVTICAAPTGGRTVTGAIVAGRLERAEEGSPEESAEKGEIVLLEMHNGSTVIVAREEFVNGRWVDGELRLECTELELWVGGVQWAPRG